MSPVVKDAENDLKGASDDGHTAPAPPEVPFWHEVSIVALLSMAQFSTQVGVGQTIAILHIIGRHFNVHDPGQLSWYMAGYSLTVGTFILPSGRLGDVFGHKKMLLVGLGWFSLWSLGTGLSAYSNSICFTVCRVFQGIGPAICLPNALAILASRYPHGRKKDFVFSIFGASAPCGSVVGAAFGSLSALRWWPWAFFSFAAVLAATALLIYLVVPCHLPNASGSLDRAEIFAHLDPAGSLVGVFGLVAFNFAWNQAPVSGWGSPLILIPLFCGIFLIGSFFAIESFYAAQPLLPFQILKGEIGLVLACIACGWSCFGIFLYYIWQFFIVLREATPLLASAWYSTNAVSGALAALLTGLFLHRIGPAPAMLMALVAYLIGTILLATAPVHQTYWAQTFVCLLILPFGMDISFPAATVMISDAMPAEHQGLAASLVNTVVNYSISIGLGLAGTVETHVNGNGITQEALLKGYRGAWWMGIGLASLGTVISLYYWRGLRVKKRAVW